MSSIDYPINSVELPVIKCPNCNKNPAQDDLRCAKDIFSIHMCSCCESCRDKCGNALIERQVDLNLTKEQTCLAIDTIKNSRDTLIREVMQ